jgi:hypothetical protein
LLWKRKSYRDEASAGSKGKNDRYKEIFKVKLNRLIVCAVAPVVALSADLEAAVVTISDVPAYEWYHGCGPTAAGSIIGYYDLNGYDSLFNASGWNDVRLTANVQDEISSPAHNLFYDDYPDETGPPPPDTSIADFFHTSEGDLDFGWSWLEYADDAFTGYANYRGYSDWLAWNATYGIDLLWEDLVTEINNDRPMMFLVDSAGTGETDHFVSVIGYDDSTMQYGFYNTWSEEETIQWETFQGMSDQWGWGVGYATFIRPGAASVPEPGVMLLMAMGLAGVGYARNKGEERKQRSGA